MTDAVLVVDRNWCVTWMNHVAEESLSTWGGRASAGEVLWEVLPRLEETPAGDAVRRAMSTGDPVSVESWYPPRGGYLEARAFPSPHGLLLSIRDVTDRVQAAVEKDRQLTSEHSARQSAEDAAERLTILQSLTFQLATAITPEQVVEVVLDAALSAVGADKATVALEREGRLHVVGFRGYTPPEDSDHREIDPDSNLPLARVFRTVTPEWISDGRKLAFLYPGLRKSLEQSRFEGALACLPLRVRDVVLGGLALAFDRPREFSDLDRAFLEAMAYQCALALDRAQIFARERQARARAEADEQRFKAILQSPMMGLVVSDLRGQVLEANDTFLRMVGYDRADLHRGRLNLHQLTAPEFQAEDDRATAELNARGYFSPFEKRYVRKDGTQVPVLVASTRIEEQQINAKFVLDISERNRMLKEAQDAARRSTFLADASRVLSGSLDYKATLEALSRLAVPRLADWCGVDVVRPDGSVERVSVYHPDPEKVALAARLSREYPADPEAPQGLHAVLRSGKPEWMRMIPDALLETSARDARHLEMIRALGLRSYICVPLRARGVTLGAITVVYAESGRIYDEADYELIQELARQASLAVDNARLYSDAQDAIRLRDEFLSVASHELKTPLTPLNLRLQGLRREVSSLQNPRLEDHVEVARRQVRKLASLVDGLLDVSRITAGRLHLEWEEVDLTALAREVVCGHEQEAARVGASIHLDAPAQVTGQLDRLRVEQVLTNLVSNAIKYGAGRPVQVRIRASGDQAVLEVEDRGIGVDPADLERIFERFERAVSGRNYGGLGLGLYITRRIAEAHGGRIEVQSVAGKGSTFRVLLPLRHPRSA